MRYGCISVGNVSCDECPRAMPYPERYLVVQEKKGTQRLCGDYALKKGYARSEKSEEKPTFIIEGGE